MNKGVAIFQLFLCSMISTLYCNNVNLHTKIVQNRCIQKEYHMNPPYFSGGQNRAIWIPKESEAQQLHSLNVGGS